MLLFLLATVGLCLIINSGYILQPARDFIKKKFPEWVYYLVVCSQCMGFWSGMVCYWLTLTPVYPLGLGDAIRIFLGGCAGSLVSPIGDAALNLLVDASSYITSKIKSE